MTSKPKNMKDGLYFDKVGDIFLQYGESHSWVCLYGEFLNRVCQEMVSDYYFRNEEIVLPMELFL